VSTTRLPADERRDQLLDIALEVFATAGFHGASMNDVAEAAGVTKPVLYQHFDSKNDLFAALLDEVGRRMRTAIDKATADATDGKDATIRGFRAYFRWVAADLDGFRLLFGGAARHDAAFAEQVRAITSDAATAIAPLIAADVDDDTRRLIAHGLVGLAEGSSRRLLAHGQPFDPDSVAETVAGLAWAGLRSLDAAN
jgi:AcrR family transcriptional regulator